MDGETLDLEEDLTAKRKASTIILGWNAERNKRNYTTQLHTTHKTPPSVMQMDESGKFFLGWTNEFNHYSPLFPSESRKWSPHPPTRKIKQWNKTALYPFEQCFLQRLWIETAGGRQDLHVSRLRKMHQAFNYPPTIHDRAVRGSVSAHLGFRCSEEKCGGRFRKW